MAPRFRARRRARGLAAGLAALVLVVAAGALLLARAGSEGREDPGSAASSLPQAGRDAGEDRGRASSPPSQGEGERGLPSPLLAAGPPSAQAAPPAAPPALSPAALALERPDAFRLRFEAPPRAAVVFDMDSGRVLWRRHARARLPIASLTKIMSALLVVERTTSRERVKITRAALAYRGQAVGLLPPGRRVPIEALLHGMLLPSGNDAAIALADHVGGSERRFVRLMNLRARRLGLACTHFVSSHGLEPGNRSCAADVAALTRLAMDERRIARVVRKSEAALRFPIRGGRLFVNNTNPLVRAGYPGAIGLKTGYTEEAGRCLAGVARRGSRRLAVVLLHSPDPSRQARKLLNSAFHSG